MAKRGSSDITSQLGSFLRTTLQQLDTVGKVVVQKGKAGKIQFDITMLKRKRKDVLAALGEVTARLAAEGRLDEEDFPELGRALAELESLDERIDVEARRARATAAGLPDDLEIPDDGEREEYDEPDPDEAAPADAEGEGEGEGEQVRARPRRPGR
jgi:hypothetical protein